MLKRVRIFLSNLLRYIHANSKNISKKNGKYKKDEARGEARDKI